MATLAGAVSITDLPPHRGLIVDLCFFEVEAADSPPPYDGDPPPDKAADCTTVFFHVDLDTESEESAFEHPFVIQRSLGYYYVQMRVTLFRAQNAKMFAQREHFFFSQRPLHITSEPEGYVTFPVSWPTQTIEELHHYGTIEPQRKRPWWRFW